MNLAKKLFTIFLILAFILSPFNFSNLFSSDSLAREYQEQEITEDIVWTTDKTVDGYLFIKNGATLTIEKGVVVTFMGEYSSISVEGKLIAKGTPKERIKFQGETADAKYSIMSIESGSVDMRNTDIENGGYVAYLYFNNNNKQNIIQRAYASGVTVGAVTTYGGDLNMENCRFRNNAIGVAVDNIVSNFSDIRINRSKFENNETYDVYNASSKFIDLQYNWWGSPDGPDEGKIRGNINYSNWLKTENFHDPVIIIPGIMGSWEINKKWKLDPIFHTYDKLYDTLDENGYGPHEDLFVFPYQWRDSNIQNAQLLKDKIQEIKQQNNYPKVDLVAHSMGGLLAREYIESDYYADDIDQLITLGTPHNGAPKSYLTWEAGDFRSGKEKTIIDRLTKIFLPMKLKKMAMTTP